MLIKKLSYDCNKVSSFLNVFRVFRYLNIYVPKGVSSEPLEPPPPPLLCVWIHLQHKCARYSRSRIYGGPQLSRQKQKSHGNNKIPHGKIKYYAAIALVLQWVFAFAVRYLVFAVKYLVLPWGLSLFGFAVRSLVLSWGILFLQWGFCFCREVFGFAVRYFVFAVRFLVLPWGFWFCLDSWGPP